MIRYNLSLHYLIGLHNLLCIQLLLTETRKLHPEMLGASAKNCSLTMAHEQLSIGWEFRLNDILVRQPLLTADCMEERGARRAGGLQ